MKQLRLMSSFEAITKVNVVYGVAIVMQILDLSDLCFTVDTHAKSSNGRLLHYV